MSGRNYVPMCYYGKHCMVKDCWSDGHVGRRYQMCVNKFGCNDGNYYNFEVWLDEPIKQECYKRSLWQLHDWTLKQCEYEKEYKREIAELKEKLKEAELEKNKMEEKFKWLEQRIMGGSD